MSILGSEPPRTSRRLGGLLVRLAVTALVVGALLRYAHKHAVEGEHLWVLLQAANAGWLTMALVFQLGTYACAGALWRSAAGPAGHRLKTHALARLAVEKLSVDQFAPTAGLAGNAVVMRALRRMGLPSSTATEAILIDIVSHHAAYALAAGTTLGLLGVARELRQIFLVLLGSSVVLFLGIPLFIAWLLHHRNWRPGSRLERLPGLMSMLQGMSSVSLERVWNRRLLGVSLGYQLGILVLDALTLWASVRALGSAVSVSSAFSAATMATIASSVSLLPGGLGSFEAAATATLVVLGIHVDTALTSTLLLRALTLWLPLGPGLILARRELAGPLLARSPEPRG